MTGLSSRCFFYFARLHPHSRTLRRGFTLTEVSIVLGIIGVVMGAIWFAATSISENNKVKVTQDEIAFVLANYRTLFGPLGVDTSGAAGGPNDITCDPGTINGWANGFFPAGMSLGLPSVGCISGDYNTYPTNPWGGYMGIQADKNIGVRISVGGIPLDACVRIASQLPANSDILFVTINEHVLYNNPQYSAVAPLMPITPAAAAGACAFAAGHEVSILYKVP